MSLAQNQARTFLRLLAQLRPHWRRDPALPARIQAWFSAHREFGSRDRRLYRELAYTTLRYLPWIEPHLDSHPEEALRRLAWLVAETPATRHFCAAYATGERPSGDKAELLPAWFRTHCLEVFSGAELDAQLRRATLWLRLQTDRPARVIEEIDSLEWEWRRSPLLPDAVAVLSEVDVTKTKSFTTGRIEVQDLGSQLILASVGAAPGGHWLDACAGAGGKTLQLARLLGETGEIDAHDIRKDALAELRVRAERAGLRVLPAHSEKVRDSTRGATIRIVDRPDTTYDGVIVDAPCSGSGTWRRAPHLKWITTEAQIAQAAETQRTLLATFSRHVRPGGRLIYATCSLSSRENEEVVAHFLGQHPEYQPEAVSPTFGLTQRGAGWLILAAQHDTDGFFFASLRRQSA